VSLSLSRRLALMYAASGFLVFSLFGLVMHRFFQHQLDLHQRSELATRLEVNEPLIRKTAEPARWQIVCAKLDAIFPADGAARFWVLSANPQYRYGGDPPAGIEALGGDGYGTLQLPGRQRPLRALVHSIAANGDRPEIRLVAAIDQRPYFDTLHALTFVLVATSIAGMLLVAGLGYWIARIGLRPLTRLSDEARSLSPSKLSQRLPGEPLPPEIAELAASFNGALDRLESAYQQLEGFNADVAHELRTPLTNLIGLTQVALSRERSASELQEMMQSNLEELDRLRAIINDMLFLARADQGELARNRVSASLAQEVSKTVDFLEVVLDEAGVRVRVEGDAQIEVERALLGRAVNNLLLNAVQHSAQGSEVLASIARDQRGVRVSVSNPGPVIAAEQLERLFARFYRLDGARSGSRDNHGLGLAIVKAIAVMHGGQVFVSSDNGINTFGFTLA